MSTRLTIPAIASTKVRDGAKPLVMMTAYDAPTARVCSEAEVDIILVGDSLAMVVLGYDDTLQLTIDDMAYHVAAVARTKPKAIVVGDMPWLSYHTDTKTTVENAAKLIRAGAQAVKLEGGRKRLPMIEALRTAEIPVVGHIGLTPQSMNVMGGFKIQARQADSARSLIAAAKSLEAAGCCAFILEGVPDIVGKMVTEETGVPIIGIGAGADTDGQVLVYHDVIGLENRFKPKFVRRYGTAFEDQVEAIKAFSADVRDGSFPSEAETYHANDGLTEALGLYGSVPDDDVSL